MRLRLRVLEGHRALVRALAFRPDGRVIASGANDRALRLWRVDADDCVVCSEHTSYVTALAFSADRLVTGSADRTARVRDPESGATRSILHHPGPAYAGDLLGGVLDVALCGDGSLLATVTSRSTLLLWELATGASRPLPGLKKPWCERVTISPDGRWISAATEDKTARLWSAAAGKSRLLKGHGQRVTWARFAPDGRFLATAAAYDPVTYAWEPSTRAGAQLRSSRPGAVTERGCAPAISSDGRWLARANHDHSVELWDVSAPALAASAQVGVAVSLHATSVRALDFSPDGQTLAITDTGGQLTLVAIPSGRAIARVALGGMGSRVLFSPDGTRLATCLGDAVTLVELDG